MDMEHPSPLEVCQILETVRRTYGDKGRGWSWNMAASLRKLGLRNNTDFAHEVIQGASSYLAASLSHDQFKSLPKDATVADLCALLSRKVILPRILSPRDVLPALHMMLQVLEPKTQLPPQEQILGPWAANHFADFSRAVHLISRGGVPMPYTYLRYPRWNKILGLTCIGIFFLAAVGFLCLGIFEVENPRYVIIVWATGLGSLITGALILPQLAHRRDAVMFEGPWPNFDAFAQAIAAGAQANQPHPAP